MLYIDEHTEKAYILGTIDFDEAENEPLKRIERA